MHWNKISDIKDILSSILNLENIIKKNWMSFHIKI